MPKFLHRILPVALTSVLFLPLAVQAQQQGQSSDQSQSSQPQSQSQPGRGSVADAWPEASTWG